MAIAIRPLVSGDFQAYRLVRLRALAEHPEAFSSSFDEEATPEGDARMRRRLEPRPEAPFDAMLGAFDGDKLVGTIGMTVDMRAKLRHQGLVIGMYVVPERGGEGIGTLLLEAQIARASGLPGLTGLVLTVTRGNEVAERLYKRAGFVIVGREPEAMRVDGIAYDKVLMFRPLA